MKKLILTLLILVPFITRAQVTLIPDQYLENYLVYWGYDTDGVINGQILTTDALNVTEIDFLHKGPTFVISNLGGLNDFFNLETFKLTFNTLKTVNFTNLSNLKNLYFDTNQLTTFDVTPLAALEELEINDTSTDVPIYAGIRELDFSNSINFKSLHIQNLPHLEFINLRNNTANSVNILIKR